MGKVVVIVTSPDFTAKNYEQVWEDLRAAGFAHPKGLISHVGYADPEGGWKVVDVWESADAFSEFGKTLMPIIEKMGVKMNEPVILPAHYVYQPEGVPA